MASGETSGRRNTTFEFLRSFSVVEEIDNEEEEEEDFDVLSPIPESADSPDYREDILDGATRRDTLRAESQVLPFVPFRNIHHAPVPFSTQRVNCWIPHLPVEVKITDTDKCVTKVLNPYLYTVEVKHGEFSWTVKRRYKHFRQLHDALVIYRAKYALPIPNKEYRERRRTMKRDHQVSVKFPLRPDYLINDNNIQERKNQLEKYLCSLLRCKSFKNHAETMRFFEVSPVSFVNKLGKKGKEGLVKKCSGGRRMNIGCCGCLRRVHFAGTWNRRWLVIKDNFLAYIRPEDGAVSDVMLMDSDFQVECGMAYTGAPHGVLISNLNRKLLLKCWTSRKAREWKECLENRAQTTAYEYTQVNRFKSYAPIRQDSYARWFVDAASYLEAVADALEKAKEEIFITDWWLSPEIYMKRPMTEGDRWRLDVILQRKADAGVKIFVLLYKEIELALGINSRYSKHILLTRNPQNIRVLRHPDHGANGVLLWAHHEKLVVIDQSVAFLGGIDLCYGRWDDEKHRLKDLGSVDLQPSTLDLRASDISVRPEESTVTDTTEVPDDHGSPSHLTVPKTLPLTHASPADVRIHIIPPSPDESTNAFVESHVVPNHQSETVISPDITCTVNSEPQSSSIKNEEIVCESEQLESVNTSHEHSSDADSDRTKLVTRNQDFSDNASTSITPVLETERNQKNTQAVTLWKEKADQKNLKLIIPEKANTVQASKGKLQKTKAIIEDDEDDSGIQEQRHSASSDVSEHSQSGLIGKQNSDSKKKTIGKGGNDVPDMATAAVRLKTFQKLKGGHDKERNNNQGNDPGDGQEGPSSPGSNPMARRRWKMVFNVSKFESVVKQDQVPEKIPRSLLQGDTKQKRKHFLMDKFRERKGSFDIRLDLLPPDIQRTKSEQDIAEKGLRGSSKLWIGKDYVNFIHKDFVELEAPYADFIDRKVMPRMPWHDIGAVVYGKGARDVARHFIARWNFTKLAKCKKNNDFPLLLPKNNLKCQIPQSIRNITFNVKTQILRSSSGWSAGIESTEYSIHEAYIHCIENSKHYIYIENQFFITQIENNSSVSNEIGNALYKRILRAFRADEPFRVFVVMPLLPAFEGEFGTPGGTALQAVTHWNYSSVCRGGFSIIEKLSKEVPDPRKYIIFCGLRTHDELNGKPVTELVYVHSKLMIVDDDTVIIGSANINDRSMLGKRDSEMAILVEDLPQNRFEISFGGCKHMAGRFGSSLRRTLFNEHLGLGEAGYELDDIVSDSFYKEMWIKTASINTLVYDKVFHCIPCDSVYTFADLKRYQSEPSLVETNQSEAVETLKKVKGYVVLLPMDFLKNENLAPKVGTKEAILPTYLWT